MLANMVFFLLVELIGEGLAADLMLTFMMMVERTMLYRAPSSRSSNCCCHLHPPPPLPHS
jgi:hypothetical protein